MDEDHKFPYHYKKPPEGVNYAALDKSWYSCEKCGKHISKVLRTKRAKSLEIEDGDMPIKRIFISKKELEDQVETLEDSNEETPMKQNN
jgi:hypothetical protein